ncbi:uncharacterized protein [Littorina saxatilis]|uniref:uncharacterized protein isoform X2 n=1 Tax=Littorina saxatilis TaxID=31220 RepID=UPI0038B6780A
MREGTAWRHGVLLFVLLLSSLQGFDAEPCNKFASVASDQKVAVTVEGKCYYGFKQPQQWNDAVARCEGEGAHLVHLQTAEKQFAVYAALGSEFNQHWTGLRYLEGSWRWYYNSSYVVTATEDVTARWQGAPNGESAYTTTSNMATLTAVQLNAWYKAVCEESGFGAETLAETSTAPLAEQTSPSLTQASTSLASETAPRSETSTASISSATSNGVQRMTNTASAGAEKFGYFHKQTSLSAAQFLIKFHNVTGLACADRCLKTSGCRHFELMKATKVCRVYEEHSSPSPPFPTCGAEGSCYTKMF